MDTRYSLSSHTLMQQALAAIAASQEHQFNAAHPRPNHDGSSDIRLRMNHSTSSSSVNKFNAAHARPTHEESISIARMYTSPASPASTQNKFNAVHTHPNHDNAGSSTRANNSPPELYPLVKLTPHSASKAQTARGQSNSNIHASPSTRSDVSIPQGHATTGESDSVFAHQDLDLSRDRAHVSSTGAANIAHEASVLDATNQAGSKKTVVKDMIEPKNSDSGQQRMYSIEPKHHSQTSGDTFAGEHAQKTREIHEGDSPTAAVPNSDPQKFSVTISIPGDVGTQKDGLSAGGVENVAGVSSDSATSTPGGYWGERYSASAGTSRELHACVCLCVCMYVCLYTYIWGKGYFASAGASRELHVFVFVCVCVYLCVYVCTHIFGVSDILRVLGRAMSCMHVFVCLCVSVCVCIHINGVSDIRQVPGRAVSCMCLCLCLCKCVCRYLCVYMYTCMYIYTHMHTLNTYIYIYIYTHTHTHAHTQMCVCTV
jgi:hypothetical protein